MLVYHEFIKPKPIVQRNNMRVDEEASRKYDYEGFVSVVSLSLQNKNHCSHERWLQEPDAANLAQSYQVDMIIVRQSQEKVGNWPFSASNPISG